ncbi:hypothetical protein ACS0TY_036147 [Phlomoides rotata]
MDYPTLQVHILANIVLVIILSSSSVAAAPLNCSDQCGDVSIPFPFGTTEGCYLSEKFFINCKRSFPDNHKPFVPHSRIEITNISLEGQLTVLQPIAYRCPRKQLCTCVPDYHILPFEGQPGANYESTGCTCIDDEGQSWINLESFTVNNTANKFTVVGCDTTGVVSGKLRGNRNYTTGCIAMCSSKADLENGTCNGLGCCQASFPKHIQRVDLRLTSEHNYTYVKDFNRCGFAFVVEKTAFNFLSNNLTSLKNVTRLPMVVDWGVGNGTCKQAYYNTSTYACKSVNSTCYDLDNGYGYRCACTNGYQGNPYLVDGCQDSTFYYKFELVDEMKFFQYFYPENQILQSLLFIDIDECQDPALHHCEENRCKNTQGSYECFCHEGYVIR